MAENKTFAACPHVLNRAAQIVINIACVVLLITLLFDFFMFTSELIAFDMTTTKHEIRNAGPLLGFFLQVWGFADYFLAISIVLPAIVVYFLFKKGWNFLDRHVFKKEPLTKKLNNKWLFWPSFFVTGLLVVCVLQFPFEITDEQATMIGFLMIVLVLIHLFSRLWFVAWPCLVSIVLISTVNLGFIDEWKSQNKFTYEKPNSALTTFVYATSNFAVFSIPSLNPLDPRHADVRIGQAIRSGMRNGVKSLVAKARPTKPKKGELSSKLPAFTLPLTLFGSRTVGAVTKHSALKVGKSKPVKIGRIASKSQARDGLAKATTLWTTRKGATKALDRFSNNPNNPKRATPKLSKHDHYKEHKAALKEAGLDYKSADAYAKGAQNFLNNPPKGSLTKVRRKGKNKGDIIRFNPDTKEYAVMTKSGIVKTYYIPKPKVTPKGKGYNSEKFKSAKEYFYGG